MRSAEDKVQGGPAEKPALRNTHDGARPLRNGTAARRVKGRSS
jgi:hypothetical protein